MEPLGKILKPSVCCAGARTFLRWVLCGRRWRVSGLEVNYNKEPQIVVGIIKAPILLRGSGKSC